jgi:hypothetical protein
MKPISKHLPFAELADLAEGRLAPEARQGKLEHLNACSRCSAKLSRLEQVISLMRTDDGADAPPALVSQAINLFRARAASDANTSSSFARRILAALSFDSLQMSPAYGVRSGHAAARQLLYSAGENDLDLRVTRSGEDWVVAGQLLGADCEGLAGAVELQGAENTVRAALNEQCEFRLPAVASGSYTLRVRLGDELIEIPELELKA